MSGKRAKLLRAELRTKPTAPRPASAVRRWRIAAAFILGLASASGFFMLKGRGVSNSNDVGLPTTSTSGHRSVAQLAALSDAELEKVDIVEMSVAVACEIPGLHDLDCAKYQRLVDGWTAMFRQWLPSTEEAFHRAPQKYENDIRFFRLGMMAQFLDEKIGVAYVEDQRQAQVEDRRAGRRSEFSYTDPGHLLLHGLLDTKRGTCATMPTLHVAIARRLGWPVALACVNSHFVCRFDDGKIVYNIEATDTGRGGFAAGSDQDYITREGVSQRAISVGCDLRKLTAREMLGVFVECRGRYFQDTGQHEHAARNYALAYSLFPNNRKIHVGLAHSLSYTGEKLFAMEESGHPITLAGFLMDRYRLAGGETTAGGGPRGGPDPFGELRRVEAINRANREMMENQPYSPVLQRPPRGGRQFP